MSNVVKFPYDASRRVYSRRPRRSKNGTPEERAAKAAVAMRQLSTQARPASMSGVEFAMYYETLPLTAQLAISACLNRLTEVLRS